MQPLSLENHQKLCILQAHSGKTWRTENGRSSQDYLYPDLPPFSHVGIDYFGHIEVKRGHAQVIIFTCLASRAIHPQMASFLTADSCINAIGRFISRRGSVLSIRTDCGTNFAGAQRELQEALKELNHQKIQNTLLIEGTKWFLTPPFGAHHGEVWERLIRIGLVK